MQAGVAFATKACDFIKHHRTTKRVYKHLYTPLRASAAAGSRKLHKSFLGRGENQPARLLGLPSALHTSGAVSEPLRNIFDLLDLDQKFADATPADRKCLDAIFDIREHSATCIVGEELATKYGGDAGERKQRVLSITNKLIWQQTLYNEARTRKPQTFLEQRDVLAELSGNTSECDFCRWAELTAEDEWGRIETDNVVSASNLFKVHGLHGLILFKHHDPLQFSLAQLGELMSVSHKWFKKAHASRPEAVHPMFLWNCLPRSGASQFHGHAQTVLSDYPFPQWGQLDRVAEEYSPGDYYTDILRAHRALGLMLEWKVDDIVVYVHVNISPYKDMETVIYSPTNLSSAVFASAMYCVLRCLIDDLGMQTFNVGISGISLTSEDQGEPGSWWSWQEASSSTTAPLRPLVARVVGRGKLQSRASDFGALEVLGGTSIGHTDPFLVKQALDAYWCRFQGGDSNDLG